MKTGYETICWHDHVTNVNKIAKMAETNWVIWIEIDTPLDKQKNVEIKHAR